MSELSRRRFITQTSIGVGVALAGAAGVAAVHQAAPALAPVTTRGHSLPDFALAGEFLPGPIVVHVRNVATAEVAVLVGTSEIVYHDPDLVARLVKASQAAEAEG